MILTGKCKKDFEEWFEENTNKVLNLSYAHSFFDKYPESMRWGVYQDFFDSKELNIFCFIDPFAPFGNWIFAVEPNYSEFGNYNSRKESQTAAIEKANEIYNDQ